MRSYQEIPIKHLSNYIAVSAHSGLRSLRIVSIRDCVYSGWCSLGIMSIWDYVYSGIRIAFIRDGVHSGLCPFRIAYRIRRCAMATRRFFSQ